MDDVAIRIRHVAAGYSQSSPVLKIDEWDVSRGNWHGIVGPSGCGKTTLLNLILGRDVVVSRDSSDSVLSVNLSTVGFVSQESRLVPWKTAIEHIKWASARADSVEAGELLAEVGLSGHEGKYPDELSGGMARRLMIATAMAASPDMLILDEPFSALDPITKSEIVSVVRSFCKRSGCTLLVVSHDYAEIAALSQSVSVITHEGKVLNEQFHSAATGSAYRSEIAFSEGLRLYDVVKGHTGRRKNES